MFIESDLNGNIKYIFWDFFIHNCNLNALNILLWNSPVVDTFNLFFKLRLMSEGQFFLILASTLHIHTFLYVIDC